MATITITTTGAEDAILGPAFGQALSLPGNANTAQVKAAIINWMKNIAFQYQEQQAIQAANITPIAPT